MIKMLTFASNSFAAKTRKRHKRAMTRLVMNLCFLCVFAAGPFLVAAQDDDWPPLNYLKNDYKEVAVVAHVRISEASIVGRVGGYENWKVAAEVLEPFKGRLRKGQVIEYFHGAEAGLKREYFDGEKIVFLLAEYDRPSKTTRYSVLENSTLAYSDDRAKKLRVIRQSFSKKRASASRKS